MALEIFVFGLYLALYREHGREVPHIRNGKKNLGAIGPLFLPPQIRNGGRLPDRREIRNG